MKEINYQPDLIPLRIQEDLKRWGNSLSKSQWEIGRLANEAMEHVKKEQERGRFKGVHAYHVWIACMKYCNLSFRRIEKLALVEAKFSPEVQQEYSDWDFGYFEKVYELPDEQKMEALEFLPFFYEEYGRKPKITEFKFLFRKHIMGENVETSLPDEFGGGKSDFSELQQHPGDSWAKLASTLESLLMALNSSQQTSEAQQKLMDAVRIMQETLPTVISEMKAQKAPSPVETSTLSKP